MNKIKILVMVSFLLVIGCSSIDKKKEFVLSDQEKQSMFEKGPVEALKEAQASIDQGISSKFDYFAPKHLQQSKDLMANASKFVAIENTTLLEKLKNKENLTPKEQEHANGFFRTIALVKQYIDDGQKIKTIIETELKEIHELDTRLKELNALSAFPGDYEDIQKETRDIISEVEVKKELYVFITRASLILKMKDLEARIVIENTFKKVMIVFAKIDDKDYDELAPGSFQQAKKTLESSRSFTRKNPRDLEGVKKAGADALLAVNHAYFIAKEVEGLKEIFDDAEAEDIEKVVLKYEGLLNKVRESLSMQDIRDRSLYDQSISISSFAKEQFIVKNKEKEEVKEKVEEQPAREIASEETEVEKEKTEENAEEKPASAKEMEAESVSLEKN